MREDSFWLGRLHVRSAGNVLASPPREYLVKGLISPAEMSLWWGPPKSGKSFLALHVTYAVAQGRAVFGRRVKRAKVLYLAAEGAAGLGGRIKALRGKYGVAEGFYLVTQGIDLRNSPTPGADKIAPSEEKAPGVGGGGGHLGEVIALVRALGVELVVVDTLNRALAGGDENGSKDMGGFIANVTEMIHATGVHVLVIHHGTKSEHSTPRGHSSLIGAADLVMEVARVKDGPGPLLGSATVTAAKDDPDGVAFGFSAETVRIGVDADGDSVTTLLVQELASAPDARKGSAKDRALEVLRGLVRHDPKVRVEAWKAACLEAGVCGENPKSAERQWRRVVEALEAGGRIVVGDGFVRVASAEETAGVLVA